MDYSKEARCTVLGARLRRLSEQLDRDYARIYALHGVTFEQRWFGILNQVNLNGPLSIGDLAILLGITHVSVTQSCQSMTKAGLLLSAASKTDARKRLVRLSKKGASLIEQLTPLWKKIGEAGEQLNEEVGGAIDLLDRLDAALKDRALYDRILDIK